MLGAVLIASTRETPVALSAAPERAAEGILDREELERLAVRVGTLEKTLEAAAGVPRDANQVRTPGPATPSKHDQVGTALQDLQQRVVGLEQALRRSSVASPGRAAGTIAEGAPVEQILSRLQRLRCPRITLQQFRDAGFQEIPAAAWAERIEILERLVREYPDHPEAAGYFLALLRHRVVEYRTDLAMDLLDRYGSRLALPEWQVLRLRADIHQSGSEWAWQAETLDRLAGAPAAPVNERARARFERAQAADHQGRMNEARELYRVVFQAHQDPTDPELWSYACNARLAIARTFATEKRRAEARAEYERIIEECARSDALAKFVLEQAKAELGTLLREEREGR